MNSGSTETVMRFMTSIKAHKLKTSAATCAIMGINLRGFLTSKWYRNAVPMLIFLSKRGCEPCKHISSTKISSSSCKGHFPSYHNVTTQSYPWILTKRIFLIHPSSSKTKLLLLDPRQNSCQNNDAQHNHRP